MGESAAHSKLVRFLFSWVCANLFGGDSGPVLVDLPESPKRATPPRVGGYTPDLYGQYLAADLLVIGEAKTAWDLERTHTTQQLEAFLYECQRHDRSALVLAVPWDLVRLANGLLRDLRVSTGSQMVDVIVLEKLVV